MKKIFVFAFAAALVALASCQKPEPEQPVQKDPVFTAKLANTKTTVDASTGKVSWESSDEITITDASTSTSVVYAVSSITGDTATFEKKEGETGTLGSGPYTATYGTANTYSQTLNGTSAKLYMTASSSTTELTFDVISGLLKINLTTAGQSIKKIAVVSTTDKVYTLTCPSAQSIDSATDFYIAVPAGNYRRYVFINSSNGICTKNAKSGKETPVSANEIKPITFSGLSFTPFTDGLPGAFSVAAGKQVRFSAGNLQATYTGSGYSWAFAAHQYDCVFSTQGTSEKTSLTVGDILDTFGWSIPSTSFGTSTTKADYSGSVFIDWGQLFEGLPWRTLSHNEWYYLVNTRTVNGGKGKNKSFKVYGADTAGISIDGNYYYGIFLYPDDYSGTYNESTWAAIEAANIVFLPATGKRNFSPYTLTAGIGYHSATMGNTANSVAPLSASGDGISFPGSLGLQQAGLAVRLVTDVN